MEGNIIKFYVRISHCDGTWVTGGKNVKVRIHNPQTGTNYLEFFENKVRIACFKNWEYYMLQEKD